jgi:endonuclease-3 related protein
MKQRKLMDIYHKLFEHFGPRGWWPGESRLEIMLGAILTQAVAWKNVEKAIAALQEAGLLDFSALLAITEEELAELIKPALYHRQKARRLKILLDFIAENYGGDIDLMFSEPLPQIRARLLALWGIGPETADSILLYAGNYPVFVVDAYTIRIFSRLGWVEDKCSYEKMQGLLQCRLPADTQIYNEYHALLVALGANYCKKKRALCQECPLAGYCPYIRKVEG